MVLSCADGGASSGCLEWLFKNEWALTLRTKKSAACRSKALGVWSLLSRSPCGAPSSSTRCGVVDEHCPSPAVKHVVVCLARSSWAVATLRQAAQGDLVNTGRDTGAAFLWLLSLAAQGK